MVIEFLRGILGGGSSPEPRTQTFYHWRCSCGAHSRGGDPFESDAEYNAQRHQWRNGIDHPMPEIYSNQREID